MPSRGRVEAMAVVDDAELIERARRLVAASERIVVLTGAGISTDSGIPDFRGPQGVWTRNPKAERSSHISEYVRDPEVRKHVWQTRLASPAWTAEPNPGHLALVDLERRGKLHTLVTQNIDGLHHRAGHDADKIVEIHGTMRRYVCLSCDDSGPMEPVLERLRAGEEDPPCRACGGILKSATISFGQSLVEADLARAARAAKEADLMLSVGSTLTVSPACHLVPMAASVGASVVIVNAAETPYDDLAQAVLRTPISEVLPLIVA